MSHFLWLVIVSAFPTASMIWQLRTGQVLGRDWKVWYRRETQPGKYWVVITLQAAMILLFIVGMARI
jgi:hypothetical protein